MDMYVAVLLGLLLCIVVLGGVVWAAMAAIADAGKRVIEKKVDDEQ